MSVKIFTNFYSIVRNPWLNISQLCEMRNKKLRKIIRYAYENVIYYHNLFDSIGISPQDIKCVEDLQKIPITYKSNLQRQNKFQFLSKHLGRNIISMATSGETGFPLEAKLTREEYIYWKFLLLRFFLTNGARLKDKFVVLAHPFRFPRHKQWFQYLGILQHKYISALDRPDLFTSEVIKSKADVILGYAGALKLFLLELEKKPKIKDPPRLIFSSAERLDDRTRVLARKLLGCDIIDVYSAVETGPIAWECERRKGYHINIDSVVIECIDDKGRPQVDVPGRIVCTNLFNFTMPFIRYCIDDIGILTREKCDCGRNFPLLKRIEGKTSDFLVLKDRIISPAAMESVLEKYIENARYKVIQYGIDNIELELFPGLEFDAGNIPGIKRGIMEDLCCEDININIKIIKTDISHQEKFRTVVSYVPLPFL